MAAFVIVPGACTPAAMFQNFCDFAKKNGVTVVAVQLATVGRNLDQPVPGVAEDVQAICRVAEPLLDDGKEVIIVASSLGGVVATQCLEALCATARASQGKKGGVDSIAYVASLVLEPNLSPLDFFGPSPPPVVNTLDGNGYIEFTVEQEDGTVTFSDLPAEEARKLRAEMARYHSRRSFETKLTYPGYKYVKAHYVICEEDQVIPKEAQLALIETLKRCSEHDVTTHSIPAGHVPFISRPEVTLQALREVAGC